MKPWMLLLALAVLSAGAAALTLIQRPPIPPMPKGVPIADIAGGRVEPSIGLGAPFPRWAPLPNDDAVVVGAEVIRPQPPYGASAVLMLRIKGSFEAFAAAYRRRLAAQGFAMRPIPVQPNLVIDRPVAQFAADESEGGHVIYVTFRGSRADRYVQLTFWAPPAPRLRSGPPGL